MKIVSINVYIKNLKLTRPYTIAFKTIADVQSVFVEIVLENGIVGIGAANPSKEVVGEDVKAAFENLSQDKIQSFIGRDIRTFYSIIHEVKEAFPNQPGTLAAMDIALHDAFCQFLEVPIVKFLGQKIKYLPTSITIGIKNVPETIIEAKEYFDLGFKILKVKLGIDFNEDIERIAKLREVYGNDFSIRIDANQGYDLAQLRQFFKATEKYNVELIEQPLPVGKEMDLKLLSKSEKAIIAADESLKGPASALFLAQDIGVGIFNIKLLKCGGIAEAQKLANIAHAGNIDLFWGCNDESIVGITAALHVAFSCQNTKYIDLDGSFDLAEDIVNGGFVLNNGLMSISDLPGLGVKKIF